MQKSHQKANRKQAGPAYAGKLISHASHVWTPSSRGSARLLMHGRRHRHRHTRQWEEEAVRFLTVHIILYGHWQRHLCKHIGHHRQHHCRGQHSTAQHSAQHSMADSNVKHRRNLG